MPAVTLRCRAKVYRPGWWRATQCAWRAAGEGPMRTGDGSIGRLPACGIHQRATLPYAYSWNGSKHESPVKETVA